MYEIVAGLETEVPLAYFGDDNNRSLPYSLPLLFMEEARQVSSSTAAANRSIFPAIWYGNAGRLSIDISHIEWATPECTDPFDVVAYEDAGMSLIRRAHAGTQTKIENDGGTGEVWIAKNNCTPSANSTWGCHENYLLPFCTPQYDSQSEFLEAIYANLVPFLVLRTLLCGAGKLGYHFPRVQPHRGYQIAQRPDFIYETVSPRSTSLRPMINPRLEYAYADSGTYQRLHIIVGDSNRSSWSTFFKVGATQLILKMFLDGYCLPDVPFRDPVAALRLVSHDLTLRAPLPLATGESASALQLLGNYLYAAQDYVGYGGSTSERFLLEHWAEVHDALDGWSHNRWQTDANTNVAERRLDWCIKRRMIHTAMDRYGWHRRSPQLHLLEEAYHDLRPENDLYTSLVNAGKIDRFPEWQRACDPLECPPLDTRAWLRGQAVRAGLSVGWDSIVLPNGKTVAIDDPLDFGHAARVICLYKPSIPAQPAYPLATLLAKLRRRMQSTAPAMSFEEASQALHEQRWERRREALRVIANEDFSALHNVLARHPSRQTRHDAILLLIENERIGSCPRPDLNSFLAVLIKLMIDKAQPVESRVLTARLLLSVPLSGSRIKLLTGALKGCTRSAQPRMRICALRALHACDKAMARPYIEELKADLDPEVRRAAGWLASAQDAATYEFTRQE
ncbi:MAG: proteasome accessory factor PafA2 family protein [Caldilineaceae bacterium]